MQQTSTDTQQKTSIDPAAATEHKYVAYFALDDEQPIAVIREDHVSLSNTHFRTEMADFENIQIVPLENVKFPVTASIKAAIKSKPADSPKRSSDVAKELHDNAIRYEENVKLQDEVVRAQVRKDAVQNAAPEEKAEIKQAVDAITKK